MGATSNHHCWYAGGSNIMECRDVIWCVYKYPKKISAQDVSASPYLLSLGLSKSSMAGVFVAGPLSGLIVQPLIGM